MDVKQHFYIKHVTDKERQKAKLVNIYMQPSRNEMDCEAEDEIRRAEAGGAAAAAADDDVDVDGA